MGNDTSTKNRETNIVYGAAFGAAFGAALGVVFEGIGIAYGVAIGVIIGTTIAVVFGNKIVQLLGDRAKTKAKEETD